MAEGIHVLATFDSQETLLEAMASAVGWVKLTEDEARRTFTSAEAVLFPDPYASKALRPGLNDNREPVQARMERDLATSLYSEGDEHG